jgi:SAM-dependent methyltransferase
MTYFKNVDLASKYNISEATVRNWVKMTKEGKLNLTLHEEKGRTYVANDPSNIKIIEKLVSENKKYRNSKAAKTVTPKPEFYKLFDQNQIYDIVRNLEIHHEIPRQYNYFDGGADEWDRYIKNLTSSETPSIPKRTIDLLKVNAGIIDYYTAEQTKLNIVDIGAGNAQPVKDFLKGLLERKILNKYIAIDISPTMLKIAEQNIREWFGNEVIFEGHQLDITKERFAHLLINDYLADGTKNSANLVLLLGSTPSNFREPDDVFRIINDSMNPNDLFLYDSDLKTDNALPEWFQFDAKPGKPKLLERHRLVFNLLNIDDSLFDVEMGFDPETKQQHTRAKFKVAITLNFQFEDGTRSVELNKGDQILLWRFLHVGIADIASQLEHNNFYLLHSSHTQDRRQVLTISEVKK